MATESKPVGSISVIVPVYNSEAILPTLIKRLEPVLASLACEYEVLLINDASRDRSWEVIRETCACNPCVRGVNLMRNYGQHNALLCGIRAARHEITVTMDDDLQHPPEEIPRLVTELLKQGADLMYGRPEQEQHGSWRNLASRATKLGMQEMIGTAHARDISSFRAFRTRLREGFANFQGPFVVIDVLLSWTAAKTSAIDVKRDARKVGHSNYSSWKLAVCTMNAIMAFSTVPLRAATLVGLLMAVLGFVVLVYVVAQYLVHGSQPGFPFLASIIAIFSGAQLLALGVIGEYLGRVFLRSLGRPVYAVKEMAGEKTSPVANRPA